MENKPRVNVQELAKAHEEIRAALARERKHCQAKSRYIMLLEGELDKLREELGLRDWAITQPTTIDYKPEPITE